MGLLEAYLKNPCGTLSVPYWKNKNIEIPESMKIVHSRNYADKEYYGYIDTPYFRVYHALDYVEKLVLDGFYIRTATQEDIPVLVDVINRSYSDLSVTYEQLWGYTQLEVYDSNLWIIVYDAKKSNVAGCGIAELDRELQEGILEWIQVLPEYRGKKIGQLIVKELLHRLARKAKFATVSGKVNASTGPEQLYRKCGFTGNDVWHILVKE